MEKKLPTIKEIGKALETWAAPATAQSYDNVGLQIGDARRPVERVLIALDLTPQVLEEAKEMSATLVITHHPLIFSPLRNVTAEGFVNGLAFRMAEAGIALYSIHTNLDAARDGVSFALAQTLGLTDVRFLEPLKDTLYKLVTFVPGSHFHPVREALADAGAGQIGDYRACAFSVEGKGFFQPGDQSNPFLGTAGGPLEEAEEFRLEVEVERWQLGAVLHALKAAHPYEEVAYDVYPVAQASTRQGMGAVGVLEEPMPLADFLAQVAARLDARSLRFTGDPNATVKTVAVCGGSGSSLTRQALKAGADAFVTADITYHKFFDVLDLQGKPQMALIDAGHYETEAMTETLLQSWLQQRFPHVSWLRTRHRTSPMQTFIPS